MKIIPNKINNYINTPTKCFIPKCKAHCCIDAPLPEGFIERFQSRIQRSIYGGLNIGKNDPKDTYNSIVYNTRPIQIVGIDRNTGEKLYGISKDMMKKLELKSMEDIKKLVQYYDDNDIKNYCPFITDYARCGVYEHRPDICREFGTSMAKVDRCPEKSSRLDILKFYIKDFFNSVKNSFKYNKQNKSSK